MSTRSKAAIAIAGLALGAAPAQARPIAVPRDYPTIQAALDAAPSGSTVAVARGTYTEEVVVAKDVDLRGAGAGATVIKSPAALTPYGTHHPDGRLVTAIVRVGNGARARISDITVAGPIPCGIEVSGIQVLQGAKLDLADSRITGIQADPSSCAADDAAGRAVVYGLPPHIDAFGQDGSTAYGRIARVQVDHFQHAGISVTGPFGALPSQVTVADSVVRGGWTLPSFQAGIDIEDGATARVTGNSITGVRCGGPSCGPDPISTAQGTGITLVEATPGTQIVGNEVDGNEVGVYQVVSADCCVVAANTLAGNRYFGIVIQDGDGATNANTILGGEVGIGVVADFIDTTARLNGDRIKGTSVAPVREIDCCGAQATAVTGGGKPRR